MNAFDKQFGRYNAKKHTYELPTVWLSYFNGFNYITFGFGTYYYYSPTPPSASRQPSLHYNLSP